MKIISKKIILTSILLSIFMLSSTILFTNVNGFVDESGLVNACSESGTFDEDFTTEAYKDGSTTAWGWGTGVLTNERDFTWQILDFYNTTYQVRSVDVQGREVFVGQFDYNTAVDSISCYDINDPNSINLLSSRSSIERTLLIAVEGDLAYAGTAYDGYEFCAYNVSNPAGLSGSDVFLGGHDKDGFVTDLDIEGRRVYYTVFNSPSSKSFRVVDVENPLLPVNYPASWISSKALGLEVEGYLAYVAASTDGLYILNVSSNYEQVELGHLTLPGNATDVILDGHYAYIACGEAGVALVDVNDPTQPLLIDVYDTEGIARQLVLQGNTLFVADGPGGICVLDVVDHNVLTFATQTTLSYVWDVDLYGGTLVVADNDGIYTIKICAGDGITDFSESYYVNRWDELQVWDVRVIGDIAYIAGGPDGFYTLDVSNPNDPQLLDHEPLASGSFRRLDVKGTFAHLITDLGYYMYDIHDPRNIQQVSYLGGNYIFDVFATGDLVYITWQYGSYVCLNMSIPNVLQIMDEPTHGTNITSVWVQGPNVYTVNNQGGSGEGLSVFNSLDLTNQLRTDVDVRISLFTDVKVDGDIAYTADQNWLVVFDVSDPNNIVFLADINDDGFLHSKGVWNFGPYIMDAGGSDGVYLIDGTNFITVTSTHYDGATRAQQITSCGDYTYVANIDSLVILRHFESAADTYVPGTVLAKSLSYSPAEGCSIKQATLTEDTLDLSTYPVKYYLSADSGLHWEEVTPGVNHVFTFPGDQLRWKADITAQRDRSDHIYSISIDYYYDADESPMQLTSSIIALLSITILVSLIYKPKKRKIN